VSKTVKTEALATYLLSFPEASEEQPFGPEVDVYKVAGKMFAILSPEDDPPAISLKCDPLIAVELREEYDAVAPGYHLNKTHWNTVTLDGSVPDRELKNMIQHSFEQVVAGLPKAQRDRLARLDAPRT
jgi:predicted DNA-binding protein (MmcQ/YjbR family)